jgi:hypothetical protein
MEVVENGAKYCTFQNLVAPLILTLKKKILKRVFKNKRLLFGAKRNVFSKKIDKTIF